MAGTTFDWTQGRIHGTPNVDGYGSQDVAVVAGVQEVNLGTNSVYQLMCTQDFYFAILDLTLNESSATATRSVRVKADTSIFITTTTNRKVLSVLRVSADGTLKVTKMDSRGGR